MLVLTRKVQESVVVGDDHGPHRILKVTVLSIDGQRVKLGFEMDDHVSVHRWELWEELRQTAALDEIERDNARSDGYRGATSSAWRADDKDALEPQDAVSTSL